MAPSTIANQRSFALKDLEKDYYDLIVIGGGITGAGIALDASSRGLKVALVEKNDFASGTSSKSTKLIHGGLRYLKQFEFGLVREVGKERAIVHKLAPHLVRPEKMLLPLIKDGNYGKIITSVGLMVYDVLADVEKADQRKMLSPEETLKSEPLLDQSILEGGGLYSEYQTDDFRLVIELIKKAQSFGAVTLNYASCTNFLEKGGKICGIELKDVESNKEIKVYADFVINASGPWVDDLRSKQEKIKGKKLHLTKGVHLVVPFERVPVKQSVYFDVGDGRMIFAIPKRDITYIGTTDTDYKGDPKDARTSKADVGYLLKAVNKTFPSIKLKISDIQSSWAGIRPLIEEEGKSAGEISRKDEIFISEKGLITIAGGKLTGYRKMAKRAVDTMLEIRSDSNSIYKEFKSKTRKIKLPGNSFKGAKSVEKYKKKLSEQFPNHAPSDVHYLVDLYGDQSEWLLQSSENYGEYPSPILAAELHFSIQFEKTLHLRDFFIYRTGRLFFKIQSVKENMEWVSKEMQKSFNWSEKVMKEELSELQKDLDEATTFE